MRALQFRNPGVAHLVLSQVSDPGAPGPGEVRVRMRATSLNGHDYNLVVGRLPCAEGRILMTDGAGIVEATGRGVTVLAEDDPVISTFFPDWQGGPAPRADFTRTPGDGVDGYATEVVVRPASWFTPAPRRWTMEEAATLPTAGVTAWRALVSEGRLRPGEDVLLLGTGGVSILALQFAKMLGARVTVTSSSDEKLSRARALGADFGVNYSLHPDWAAEVVRLTGGADLVVETGGPGTLPLSIKATRIGGRIALVGVLTGIRGDLSTVALMSKQMALLGLTVGSRAHQLEMIRALDAAGMRPSIDKCIPLEDVQGAFRAQERGQHFGKVCLQIGP